jgi:hypothetical protein
MLVKLKLLKKYFALFLMVSACVMLRPTKALALPPCDEVITTYQDCQTQCANWPNDPGFCASQATVHSQSECYTFADFYYSHNADSVCPGCDPKTDSVDTCCYDDCI